MSQDLLLKFKFFQDIRMWPKNSDFDYEGWLENFSQDEQKIAQKILDFFVYFPDDIIDQMFSTVLGGQGISSRDLTAPGVMTVSVTTVGIALFPVKIQMPLIAAIYTPAKCEKC